MLSIDEPERNAAFAESLSGNFPILSDPAKDVARAYGVLAPGGKYALRWTFYIDIDGVIRHIDNEVEAERAGEEIAETLEVLGFPKRDATP